MKISKLLFIALFIFANINAYSADIAVKSKTENTIDVSVKADNKARSIIIIRKAEDKQFFPEYTKTYKYNSKTDLSKAENFTNNFVIYDGNKSEDISISALKPETKYILSIFGTDPKKSKDIEIVTLAIQPKVQTSALAFKDVTDSQIGVLWNSGDGKNRILCVTTEGTAGIPQDGKTYKSGKIGDNTCKIANSNTYVVFNSSDTKAKNQFLITGLKYEKYTFQMFEYNGNGESTNYLKDKSKNNPRMKHTLIPAPVALEPTNITSDGFLAHWKEMKNVKYFEFDLSTDPNFNTFVELYQSADVGNLDKFELAELKAGTYYYRLRAVNVDSKSANSNVIKLEIK